MKKQIIATSIIVASITTVIATEAQANADSINGVDVTTDQTQKKATSGNGETWVNDNNVWYNQNSGEDGIIVPTNTPNIPSQQPEKTVTPNEPIQAPAIIKQETPSAPSIPQKAEYIAPVKPVAEQKVPNKKYEDPINKQLKEVPGMIPSQPLEMTINVPIKKIPQMNTFNFSMQAINTFATTIIDNTFSTNAEQITPTTDVLVATHPSLIDGDIPINLDPVDHKQSIQASRISIIEKPVVMKMEQLGEKKTSRPVPKTSEEQQTITTIQFKTALMKSESKKTAQSLTKKENQVNKEKITLPTRSSRHDVKSTLLKSSSLAMMPKTGDSDSFTFQENLRIIGFILASLSLLGLSFKRRKSYKK